MTTPSTVYVLFTLMFGTTVPAGAFDTQKECKDALKMHIEAGTDSSKLKCEKYTKGG